MAPFVQGAAALLSAKVTLVHVYDPVGYNRFELYVRPLPEAEEVQKPGAGKTLVVPTLQVSAG